jgi:hypothetical protein
MNGKNLWEKENRDVERKYYWEQAGILAVLMMAVRWRVDRVKREA